MTGKKAQQNTIGTAIIVGVAVVVLGALGWVFWQTILNPESSLNLLKKTTDSATTDYSITRGTGEMDMYTNKTLGYSFEFPRKALGYTGCAVASHTPPVSGDNENKRDGWRLKQGMVELTVLSGEAMVTIAPKRAAVVTVDRQAAGQAAPYTSCDMQKTTQTLLQEFKTTPSEGDYVAVMAEHRSFVVQKLTNESDLKTAWKNFEGASTYAYADAMYTLQDELGTDRKYVNYTYIAKGGGIVDTLAEREDVWYYPKQKLVVSFAYGQSQPFTDEAGNSYLDAILKSFKVLQ